MDPGLRQDDDDGKDSATHLQAIGVRGGIDISALPHVEEGPQGPSRNMRYRVPVTAA